MSKAANTPQTLRLLAYSLTGIGAFFILLHLLLTYVLGSPGMVTIVLVVVMCAIWIIQRSQQFRARYEQEALLMQHRAFAAEVERAWERSHAHEAERRRPPAPSHASAPSAQNAGAHQPESASAKKRRKKKAREDEEETFVVDDELEAEVVEDLEDFLQHSRLRQALKKTADDLRESQKRKEDKKTPASAPPPEAPEPKKPAPKVAATPAKASSAPKNGSAATKAAPKGGLPPRPVAKDAGKGNKGKANGSTSAVNGHSSAGKAAALPAGKGPAAQQGKGWKSTETNAQEKDAGDAKDITKPSKGNGKSKGWNWKDEWYGGGDESWWGDQDGWGDGWYSNGGGWWGQQKGRWNGQGRGRRSSGGGGKHWAPRGAAPATTAWEE